MKNTPQVPNPSAFPRPEHSSAPGMSLRDYFAAKAMQGLMSNKMYDNHTPKELSDAAFMFADNMLKSRKE
jgi:hypothetical protein